MLCCYGEVLLPYNIVTVCYCYVWYYYNVVLLRCGIIIMWYCYSVVLLPCCIVIMCYC
jgi:hypothetical protein